MCVCLAQLAPVRRPTTRQQAVPADGAAQRVVLHPAPSTRHGDRTAPRGSGAPMRAPPTRIDVPGGAHPSARPNAPDRNILLRSPERRRSHRYRPAFSLTGEPGIAGFHAETTPPDEAQTMREQAPRSHFGSRFRARTASADRRLAERVPRNRVSDTRAVEVRATTPSASLPMRRSARSAAADQHPSHPMRSLTSQHADRARTKRDRAERAAAQQSRRAANAVRCSNARRDSAPRGARSNARSQHHRSPLVRE